MKKQHIKENFVRQLLDWYDQNARILPWREDISAYRVWVSEIMLQQTRVEAVLPYFERFLNALPDMKALANASDDELSKLWEGLGYYHRVKNMKKTAVICMEKYGGRLPSSYEELLHLPGIGSYTAGAIASIAYQEKVPAVDGNVLRVFSRVLLCEDDILKEATKKNFQNILLEYLPEHRSGDFNQALMEIGAMICVPNGAPRCNICPVASECLGYQCGQASRLPIKAVKKKRRIEKRTILVVVCKNEVLLHQRIKEGLLAGLYEFMNLEGHKSQKEVKQDLSAHKIQHVQRLPDAKHVFSHVEWRMKGYMVIVTEKDHGLWCTKQQLEQQYAIPSAFRVYRDALYTWWEMNEFEETMD